MKRTGSLFVVAAALVTLCFAGCGKEQRAEPPKEDTYYHPRDSVGEPARAATAPTPSSRPSLTSQSLKATLDGEPVDGLGTSLIIQHQAATLADLVAKAKPDFTFGDDGRDMMWVEGKDTDKPSFRLGRAFIYKHAGGDVSFVLLNATRHAGPPDDAFILVETSGPPTVARLFEERPIHDGGSGDYAIVKSRGPAGAVLYEIGWESGYAAKWCKERRLYVLRAGEQWTFVGEGPAEGYSKRGYCQQVRTTVDARVEWTQEPESPVRIHFIATERQSEWASSDMLQEDPSASDSMRDDLVKRREWVLQGMLPATLQAMTDRAYMLTRRGDNLDTLVRHLSSWTPGAQEAASNIQASWRRELTRLNADLSAGDIPEGRRITLPTDAEMMERPNPGRPTTAPAGERSPATGTPTRPAPKAVLPAGTPTSRPAESQNV